VSRATKITIDGITFDSIYESKIYEVLKRKLCCHPNRKKILLHPHEPVHFTGGRKLSQVHKRPTWKVDFLISQKGDDEKKRPLFAVEAKGRFNQEDKFKFLLWDIFQDIPLLVVYQGRFQHTLQCSGWVMFLPTIAFKSLDLIGQIDHLYALNAARRKYPIVF
jgi:hypothetical protein